MRSFFKRLLVIAVILWVAALAYPSPHVRVLGTIVAFSLVLVPAIVVFLFYWLRAINWGFDQLLIAVKPVPGPLEIRDGLLAEWGRYPTAAEVDVVQRALINRRNEAIGGAALSFGALYLLGHH